MTDTAIAIVGAACRFPGAEGLDAFWQLLAAGGDAVTEIGPDRWSTRLYYHPRRGESGKSYSFAAGLIDGIDLFDPAFFGISPREAAQIDPQQRLLLELAWHALEDAGIPPSRLAGSVTGVYIGASSTDYGDLRLGDPAGGDQHFVTGMALSILANRLSHVFDLRGPSHVVDAACASSLIALHEACEALRAGRVETALVGGVNLLLSPYPFIGFAQAGMLSPSGRCFAFDARADGYVRAEGGGVVVLKPLAAARADGDSIRAVIRCTALGASGRTAGLSLPSEAAQADMLREAYRRAGIVPDELAFVEMHGTGTPAGDPIEAAAVGHVLGEGRSAPLPIGSVKTNIGHLEPASGIAGLIKAMLALEHGVLPRSLYGETPNPNIPFDRLNLRLPGAAAEPIAPGGLAGVNSFGFGGAIAHAILAPAPAREPVAADAVSPPLLISARSEEALRALAVAWRETLAATPSDRTPMLLRAAARRRDHHSHRFAITSEDKNAALGDFLARRPSAGVEGGTAVRGRLAFVYSGNGAQFFGMGEAAFRASAAFRAAIGDADRALAPHLGWSVAASLAEGSDAEALRRADIAQPLLFAIQVAVTEMLRDAGMRPSGYVGHSVGEIAAAWAAGALPLAEAARIVAIRSRHQETMRGVGGMAVLALDAAAASALLAELSPGLEIAALNSRRAVTVAGPEAAIAALGAEAARRGIAWRKLDLDFAFHSAAMDAIRTSLIANLGGVESAAVCGHLVSSVTGAPVAAAALDAGHWWRNVRDPVRFAAALDTLIADGYRIFAEIGPRPVLQSYLRDALASTGEDGRAVATLDPRAAAGDPFPAIAARLHIAGHDMSGASWLDGPDEPRGLPLYPWQRTRHWFIRTVEASEATNPALDHPLLGFRQSGSPLAWRNHIDTALFPFLAEHRVDGIAVLPGAAVIDMGLAAARARHPEAAALELSDLELLLPMTFDAAGAREMSCVLSDDGDWRLTSRARLVDEPMTGRATARIAAAPPDPLLSMPVAHTPRRTVGGEALYRRASRLGLDYGPRFQTIREVTVFDDGRASAALAQGEASGDDWLIEPGLLDGAFQALLALLEDGAIGDVPMLPHRFGRVRAVAPFGRRPARAELRLIRAGARSATADIALYDAEDGLIAELAECSFARLATPGRTGPEAHCLRTELVPAPLGDPPAPAILARLPEMIERLAGEGRDFAREAERMLLFEALLAAIAREAEAAGRTLPGPLAALSPRFAGEELPDAGELWRRLLADEPEMVAELAVAALLQEMLSEGGARLDPRSPSLAALRRTAPPAAAGRAVFVAVLAELADEWPRERPLRLREVGAAGLSDRLHAEGVAARRVGDGETCDIAICGEAGACDLARLGAGLAPGGLLLATMPSQSTFSEMIDGPALDTAGALTAAGFDDFGVVNVALGPWPCEIVWARAGATSNDESAIFEIPSVFVEASEPEIAAALATNGHRIVGDAGAAGAILFAPADGDDPIAAAREALPAFARLAALAAERKLPLFLATTGAQQPEPPGDLSGAALWGFARVLRNEMPGLVLCAIDLPPGSSAAERAKILAREIAAACAETEIVWTPLGRHVPRLRRGLPAASAGPEDAIVAAIEHSGRLDRLGWAAASPREPGLGEILFEVAAVGVNFRDIMAATGILPEEALADGFAGAALGLECAGVVSAIGEGVIDIAVGDRVAGFAPAALASRVVTRAGAVIAIPPTMGLAAAATLPVAFVTALYAIDTLARLGPGETVLIHSASGGVGLAAIQIAKRCGAVVVASAGSPEKRAFLRLAGADHVCDSRELRFVAAVRAATGGAGVDVVLNSLSGQAMEASLDLLKPFGRFVELGKRDFYENRRFAARPLRRNIAYFAVDVDQLPLRRPALAKSLLAELAGALTAGEIRPLAYRSFAFAEIADALRLMQAAEHIGKLVLVPDGNAGVAIARPPALTLRPDGVYVVTGGLDGFGYATARWLAERGARHLVLIGRRGAATPGVAERLVELRALGATIGIHAADVADAVQLSAALDGIRARGLPVLGVVHAAAAIVGGMAGDLSAADVDHAFAAKLGGAVLLDQLTRDDPLDLFWLFSSATTLIGALGQGAYVAANAALEALARRRHAARRPALAIAWGPIADVGALAGHPVEREALTRRLGARPMVAQRALAALPAMVASGLPVVALADVRWGSHFLPALAAPLFDELREAAGDAAFDEDIVERLAGLGDGERGELLASLVAEAAARILRLSPSEIDRHRPLAELGMDSLMAMELRLALETRLRVEVPLMSLADGGSVAGLAARVGGLLQQSLAEPPLAGLAARHEPALDPFAFGGADPAAEE